MGRPLTGKLHTGQRRETRANGDVYVYERVTAYDPKTQKTKTVSTRLLGNPNSALLWYECGRISS